jgi:hypothetical protein
VSANLGLQDLSAQAFESDELPADLGGFDLDVFGPGWLFFSGLNYEGQVAISVFSHRFQITSIERILPVPSLSPLSLAIATGLMGLAGLHRLRG